MFGSWISARIIRKNLYYVDVSVEDAASRTDLETGPNDERTVQLNTTTAVSAAVVV